MQNGQVIKRIETGILSLLVICQLVNPGVSVSAATLKNKINAGAEDRVTVTSETAYADYLTELARRGQVHNATETVTLSAASASESGGAADADGGVEQTEERPLLTFSATVTDAGFYQVQVDFCALDGNGCDIKRALLVDGASPYEECGSFRLHRCFKDNGAPRQTTAGDEVSPVLTEEYRRQTQPMQDVEGLYALPLKIWLSAGQHTIALQYLFGDIRLYGLILEPPAELPDYEQVRAGYTAAGYTAAAAQPLMMQAEDSDAAICKTQSTLGMVADTDPAMTPRRYGYTVMNALGGTYWNTGNDSITWQFTMTETGLYKLGMRVWQNYLDGLPTHRQIAIDGAVPFAELSQYAFADGKNWRSEVLHGADGEPYLFYLEAGTHTITMSVKLGESTNGALMKTLEAASDTLSELILNIRMIIGNDPDTLYDYHLDDKLPELIPTLTDLRDTMKNCTALALSLNDKRPLLCNQFDQIAERLGKMIDDPYIIPANMSDLTTALGNFGTWISGLTNQPLLIDWLEWSVPDTPVTVCKAHFWERLEAGTVDFIRSFTKDYGNISGIESNVPVTDTLSVWIGRGTTYARELKNLADDDFTSATGVAVSLHTLPAGQLNSGSVNALMLALASGAAPDVCLGVAADSPGEFAIRHALADLTQLEGYEKVADRFVGAMLTPFTYEGGVFALPETLNFQVMMYRTDIFARLGLSVPETWNDVYQRMLPILNQNKLQFYMMCNSNYATYETFLYQHGGTFYTEDLTASALDTPEAYQAMKEYCELFTVWGMPESADLYNRMRTGEMPVGIGDYAVYLKLLTAAPELTGKWAIAPVPGNQNADGTVDHTIGSVVSEGCMIMEQCALKEQAWQFLQWWMSTQTQVRYARSIEGIYGSTARWPTANTEAFSALNWERDDLRVIVGSLESAKSQPVVLGSYYTTRHVNNAWNRVVVSKSQTVRDSMEMTVRAINKELKRRQEQYVIRTGKGESVA